MRPVELTILWVWALAIGLPGAGAEESIDSLTPFVGEWIGGEEGAAAHPFLAIRTVRSAPDGIWIETGATTRLNMGDTVPVGIHVAASTHDQRIHARVGAKDTRDVHFLLVSSAAGVLLWDELSTEADRTRVELRPLPSGGFQATLLRPGEAPREWVTQRSVTYQSTVLRVDAGGISFTIPRTWERSDPRSDRERASLVLPPPDGSAASTPAGGLVLYDFGPGGAGAVDEVLRKWAAQVRSPAGEPAADAADARRLELDAFVAHTLVASGTYEDTRGQSQPGVTMWATVLEPKEGDTQPMYLKALGPTAVIDHWRQRLDELLHSVRLER